MKITKTNAELDAIYNGLKEITADATIKFPAKATYNIIRNKKTLEVISKSLHEAIDKVIREAMGDKTEIQQGTPEYMEVVKSVDELTSQTDEVEIYTLSFDDLGNNDISPKALDSLSFMITELNEN